MERQKCRDCGWEWWIDLNLPLQGQVPSNHTYNETEEQDGFQLREYDAEELHEMAEELHRRREFGLPVF